MVSYSGLAVGQRPDSLALARELGIALERGQVINQRRPHVVLDRVAEALP